jgi:hypothetical protein
MVRADVHLLTRKPEESNEKISVRKVPDSIHHLVKNVMSLQEKNVRHPASNAPSAMRMHHVGNTHRLRATLLGHDFIVPHSAHFGRDELLSKREEDQCRRKQWKVRQKRTEARYRWWFPRTPRDLLDAGGAGT